MNESQVIKLTKKYIIDFLNALCFNETVFWDGVDQYNKLPVFSENHEDTAVAEQRGALLVHKRYSWAFRLLVTIEEKSMQSVCYRITNILKPISVDDPKREYIPLSNTKIDFSIANDNLGLDKSSAYSFSDNIGDSSVRMFKLLDFLLNSAFVIKDDKEIFEDLLNDVKSFPPFAKVESMRADCKGVFKRVCCPIA